LLAAGVFIAARNDFLGIARANPPTIGAYETPA
jgi:hypothetical protein